VKRTNSIAEVVSSIANEMNSIAKVTNSIAKNLYKVYIIMYMVRLHDQHHALAFLLKLLLILISTHVQIENLIE